MTDAYPLQWPAGWPRTNRPVRARFKTTQNVAQAGIIRELKLLGASNVVISTNIELRRDGMPYASRKAPEDPGVAVYFTLDGDQKCMPIDKWDSVGDNMQAIKSCIEALRGLDRWGAKDFINAAFQGFKALPASGTVTNVRAWWDVFEVPRDADMASITRAYKEKLFIFHPDHGGSVEAFQELQIAYREAKGE